MFKEWEGFEKGIWQEEIDVRDFLVRNYQEYVGDESFLEGPSEDTKVLLDKFSELAKKELEKGILDLDTKKVSGIDAFNPAYLDKSREKIVGFQTDKPLKRMLNPFGGLRMAIQAAHEYGYKVDDRIKDVFTNYRKTHNDGVFDVYNKEARLARSVGLLTGLPDAYGRGRIIGDYRRLPLYGLNVLIEEKINDLNKLEGPMLDDLIRQREEVAEQIRALAKIKNLAESYGFDVMKPARDAQEAVQFLYFAYLAGARENNGAAMSLGRVSSFLDIYIERDLQRGILKEEMAQELLDQFVLKLRMIRHLRTPEYNELFAGDPNWITESIGGMSLEGKSLVTKSSFRMLHTLSNLGAAPEPNMTVLWSEDLPDDFKKYCAKMSIETDSIQFENDDLMRPIYGDDYAIACCVSAMRLGKEMQFFGARCNLAKALLYAINGGLDEMTGLKIIPNIKKIEGDILSYDEVLENYLQVLEYVADLYVNTMNSIHYMHDKYAYESSQMAFHDTKVHRFMAFGVAGLSVAADSLSALKYAEVKALRKDGLAVDFEISGVFPKFGNDDDRVDKIAVDLVNFFSQELKKHKTYRQAEHTLSVLTITSNVVYGEKTGTTPDGRKKGEAFAPGANPMHGRDLKGALASLNSVSKLPYKDVCQDGISNTFSIVPEALGKEDEAREENLVAILDGYFARGAHHLNVNVLYRETLLDAMENPEKYPNLTIRVSGYAVHFNRLTRKQQQEVIKRTFHERVSR